MGKVNPFLELYLTEGIAAEQFAQLFSPVLARESETHTLFQPGNIVLVGLQGSGKTALLNLMRPEVMITYRKLADSNWPLPKEISRFVSAGINLNLSRARDFGQRTVSGDDSDVTTDALLFGDFLNYWLVDDLLNSIELLAGDSETKIYRELEIHTDSSRLNEFAKGVALHACWFGALEGIRTYEQLRESIANRIIAYRSFLNFNSELPDCILGSKTSAGEPIAVMADSLKKFSVLRTDIPVLIRIDQFEDLMGIERNASDVTGTAFRQIVMKMISERDSRVSYRVGARPYALYPDWQVFGTGATAEELRNFKILDIGELLRGREARRSLFRNFCEDVLRRRLEVNKKEISSPLSYVFGGPEKPSERAKQYVRKEKTNVVTSKADLPRKNFKYLTRLASVDPLSARLGEAWLLQQLNKREGKTNLDTFEQQPWNSPSRRWWKKERIQQALMQIAASQRQKMMWYGSSDILALSGRNILVFLSICQFIWAEYLRSDTEPESNIPRAIPPEIQNMGIHETSSYWYRKIRADPEGGDDRYRFAGAVGTDLRNGLRADRRMSYPGANGFSLSEADLDRNQDVQDFLNRCVAFGVLEWFRHTPKSPGRGQSRKSYLFSILTPYFQIPTPHIKEPRYMKVSDVRKWMASEIVNHRGKGKCQGEGTQYEPNFGGQFSLDLDDG